MSVGARIVREAVFSAENTAAAAATTVEGVVFDVNSIPLEQLDELTIYLNLSTGVTGGTFEMLLQRAIVPDPDSTNNDHWQDYIHFPQVAAATTQQVVATAPVRQAVTGQEVADYDDVRNINNIAQSAGMTGHWYDRLRVVVITGVGTSAAGVFSLYMTGIAYDQRG